MKCLIFLVFLFFNTFVIYCNDNTLTEDNNSDNTNKYYLMLEPEIIFPKQIMGGINLGFGFGKLIDNDDLLLLHGPVLGFETKFSRNDYVYGIKIGYFLDFIHLFGFSFRINSIIYNNQDQLDMRIQPEIGLIIVGALRVSYGYNFALLKTVNEEIGRHRITLAYRVLLFSYDDKWRFSPLGY
jgi:hypothetical protein